jgi:nucleoside-diphosphate-sugar epimerase
MRVLIIGGTGFIGPFVADALATAGHEVIVFHRGDHAAALSPRVRHIHSPHAAMPVVHIPRALVQLEPDVVIHMIAMGAADAEAAVQAFAGNTQRLVIASSGDVYRAYGRLTGQEPGPVEPIPLTEDAPVRERLFPYRTPTSAPTELSFYYEKILVERAAMASRDLPATVLRLPKVYGATNNADFGSVLPFREHPQWRWTHGYVENVAAAIVLAAQHPAAARRIYNVGEAHTPTVSERIGALGKIPLPPIATVPYDFAQDMVYDTTRIRDELGYAERVSYEEGLQRTRTANR